MIEHGSYQVTLAEQVLTVSLAELFNEHATATVCQQMKSYIESLNGRSFVVLLDCMGYEGSTPEAHQISNNFLRWLNKQNCLARAIVYSQKLYFDIVKNEQPAVLESNNRREFCNLAEAQQWLATQL